MREEYNIKELNPRKTPYTDRLKGPHDDEPKTDGPLRTAAPTCHCEERSDAAIRT